MKTKVFSMSQGSTDTVTDTDTFGYQLLSKTFDFFFVFYEPIVTIFISIKC